MATLERGFGPTAIQRFNRQFSVGIFADIKPGQPLDAAVQIVRRRRAAEPARRLPSGSAGSRSCWTRRRAT